MVSERIFNVIACPGCEASLSAQVRAKDGNHAGAARIQCGECERTFDVVDGIPRFVSVDNYAASFGMQWIKHARTQLDSHTGLPLSRQRLFEATQWPQSMKGEAILEAGSGAGRFTEILLSTGAEVVSFDYSRAVEANHANNGDHERLFLFQGDIYNMPLRAASFDKVMCLGVLQHTPDPRKAFEALASKVRVGGSLTVDLYLLSLTTSLHWKYLLRPLTKRMNKQRLYALTESTVAYLLPISAWLRGRLGRLGPRLLPIAEYSQLGLSAQLLHEWSILDTFDMYSPAFDKPQTERTVRRWYEECGFSSIVTAIGGNGVIGRGVREREALPLRAGR